MCPHIIVHQGRFSLLLLVSPAVLYHLVALKCIVSQCPRIGDFYTITMISRFYILNILLNIFIWYKWRIRCNYFKHKYVPLIPYAMRFWCNSPVCRLYTVDKRHVFYGMVFFTFFLFWNCFQWCYRLSTNELASILVYRSEHHLFTWHDIYLSISLFE